MQLLLKGRGLRGQRGRLVTGEFDDHIVRAQTGFVSIPLERVTAVIDPTAPLRKKGAARIVDPSFYTADLPAGPKKGPPKAAPQKKKP